MDLSKVDALRKDAEEFLIKQGEMGWKNWTLGEDLDQASLYKKYKHLFTRENIATVGWAVQEEKDPDQRRALELFRSYLMFEYIGKKIADLSDEVTNYESQAEISVDGEEISYRQSSVLLANENSHEKRIRIYSACDKVLEKVNPLLRKMEEITLEEARELGFSSYIEMCSTLKKCNYYDVEERCRTFLEKTDPIYAELLGEALKAIGMTQERFLRCDSWRMNRDTSFDQYFTEEKIIDTLKATLLAMGMNLDSQKNILIDSEKRERKYSRAVCYNIRVPEDIRVSIKPMGGAEDYRSLFHEMGHAEHFANTQQEVWEFQQLGDYTFTENFAFLFEHLLAEREWLAKYSGMTEKEIQRFLRSQAMKRLWYVRRYSAKLIYELELHAGAASPEKIYSKMLSAALKYNPIPSDEKRYLDDVDSAFYVADYLRAWFLEAMLKEKLREKFGEEWFESKEAGDYLRQFMAYGQKMEADEYARMLGYEKIIPEPLIREIQRMAGSKVHSN
ncbi:MAG: M3 family metallopeptidase [Acidobacteriota bacterium]